MLIGYYRLFARRVVRDSCNFMGSEVTGKISPLEISGNFPGDASNDSRYYQFFRQRLGSRSLYDPDSYLSNVLLQCGRDWIEAKRNEGRDSAAATAIPDAIARKTRHARSENFDRYGAFFYHDIAMSFAVLQDKISVIKVATCTSSDLNKRYRSRASRRWLCGIVSYRYSFCYWI